MASTTQSFCNQAFPGPSPRPSLLWDSADFSLVKAASLPVSVWFFCIVMWKQKQISSFHRGAWTTVTKKPQLPGTQEPPAPDGGRRDSGFQTRLMLAPEHTTVFLKTAVANTQDYKQIFSQLHPFMFYIRQFLQKVILWLCLFKANYVLVSGSRQEKELINTENGGVG